MKIIIVDDAQLIRELFKDIFLFVDVDYDVIKLIRTAGTINELGLLLETERDVDIILLDYDLGDKTAIDALTLLRAKYPELIDKTIIVSGTPEWEIQEALIKAEFKNEIYTKPLSFEHVSRILSKYKDLLDEES